MWQTACHRVATQIAPHSCWENRHMTTETLNADPLIERELALEADMRAQGVRRFRTAITEAQLHNRETETCYGHHLLTTTIEPVTKGIEGFIALVKKDGRAARAIAVRYLELIEPEVAAFMAAKAVLDGITRRQRLQAVAVRLGGMIEDEVRFQAFEEAKAINPKTGQEGSLRGYALTIAERLNKDSSHYAYKRQVLIHAMNKKGVPWEDWAASDKLHLGIKLIEIVEASTGVVTTQMFVNRGKKEYYLAATETTLEWIKNKTGYGELMCALYQPMIIPPVPWTKPSGGGYLGGGGGAQVTSETLSKRNEGGSSPENHPLSRLKLVKSRNKHYQEELRSTDLGLVYSSLNAIQNTPWKVNRPVLEAMVEVWRNSNAVVGDMPPRENEPKPSKPLDIDTNKEARDKWKRQASAVMKANFKLGSKRLQVEQTIRMAEKFASEAAIYFPYTLDFRGRVYSVPVGLNPQGHDISKGLLTFAQGKPILDQRAADWLAIHGANLWGYDKVSLEDRVQWVRENQERIVMSAKAPLDYRWWVMADNGEKAWQFLAFCIEWAGFVERGFGFVSHLPIALDGSCNGLQHFSAMLRDPVGGAATNLVPSDKPRDIYALVAERTIEKLKANGSTLAHVWLTFGITRKTAKRPVMVVPYGGTRHSARKYLIEHVTERLKNEPGLLNPFSDSKELFRACQFLAGLLWDAIQETVVAARDAMNWLQKVSQIVSKESRPLNWTAPSGFKVQQAYPNVNKRRVDTTIGGSVVKLILEEELAESIDKRRQAQGISPNFVHSLDAAALMFTVDAAAAFGIESFAMIHDSYGTHAADTDALRECLRQAFCQMYQQDVLKDFRDEIQKGLPEGIELPPLPKKGSLDINLVLQSDFFFA